MAFSLVPEEPLAGLLLDCWCDELFGVDEALFDDELLARIGCGTLFRLLEWFGTSCIMPGMPALWFT